MVENYFEDMIDLYDGYGMSRQLFIYNSAYKYSDLYIWEYDGRINFSNAFDYAFITQYVKEYNELYNFGKDIPVLIYSTNDYKTMIKILSIAEHDEYRDVLEKLDEIVKTDELSLVKEI